MSELTREEFELSRNELKGEIDDIDKKVTDLHVIARIQQQQLGELNKHADKTNQLFEQSIKNGEKLDTVVTTVQDINKRVSSLEAIENQRLGAHKFKMWLVSNFKNIVLIVGFLSWASYILFFSNFNIHNILGAINGNP